MKSPPVGHAARAALRVGHTLRSKWRIDALLGVGGFAAVYAATHRTGKRVAIKILHPQTAALPDVAARFLREAYAANSIDHPGVVSVVDDDVTEDGALFLVMDLLDGETFEARRRGAGGRLSSQEVAALADKALDVLIAAHDKGIIHRDIKPENLFLGRDGLVRVLDFGIARMFERQDSAAATELGSTMGSPAFMPGEQARGRWDLVDARSDIWSFGATMFMLLAGRPVHARGTLNETLIAAATEPAPSIASLLPEAPAGLVAVIDRALAFERSDRWPDARAFRAALRLALRGAHEEATLELPTCTALPLPPQRQEPVTVVLPGSTPRTQAVQRPDEQGAKGSFEARERGSAPSLPTEAAVAAGHAGSRPTGEDHAARWTAMWTTLVLVAIAAVIMVAVLLGRAKATPVTVAPPILTALAAASNAPARPLATMTAAAPEVGSAIATGTVEIVPVRAAPALQVAASGAASVAVAVPVAPSAALPAPVKDPFAERGAAVQTAGARPSEASRPVTAAPPASPPAGPKDPFDKRR